MPGTATGGWVMEGMCLLAEECQEPSEAVKGYG